MVLVVLVLVVVVVVVVVLVLVEGQHLVVGKRQEGVIASKF